MSTKIFEIFTKPFRTKKFEHNYILHISLFVVTFITTLLAGIEWTTGKPGPYEINDLKYGLPYSLSILFILGVHEFGHFFAAVYYKVKATLPFFIPLPPIGI